MSEIPYSEAVAVERWLCGSLGIGHWSYGERPHCTAMLHWLMNAKPDWYAGAKDNKLDLQSLCLGLSWYQKYRHPWWKRLLRVAVPPLQSFVERAYNELRKRAQADLNLLCRP